MIDRQSWLVKFRRAKCQDTLDTMRDAAIRNYEGNIRVIADIVLAHEARETEIEKGMFCRIVRWSDGLSGGVYEKENTSSARKKYLLRSDQIWRKTR